jgi:hypothetical protein
MFFHMGVELETFHAKGRTKLLVTGNRVLRTIFRPKREEVAGE